MTCLNAKDNIYFVVILLQLGRKKRLFLVSLYLTLIPKEDLHKVSFPRKQLHRKLANGAANRHIKLIVTTSFKYHNICKTSFGSNDDLYKLPTLGFLSKVGKVVAAALRSIEKFF